MTATLKIDSLLSPTSSTSDWPSESSVMFSMLVAKCSKILIAFCNEAFSLTFILSSLERYSFSNFEIVLDANDDDGVAVGIDCDDDDDDGDGEGDRDGVLGVAEISGSDDNGWVPVDTDNAGTVAFSLPLQVCVHFISLQVLEHSSSSQ